jgi:hypothetical protein
LRNAWADQLVLVHLKIEVVRIAPELVVVPEFGVGNRLELNPPLGGFSIPHPVAEVRWRDDEGALTVLVDVLMQEFTPENDGSNSPPSWTN